MPPRRRAPGAEPPPRGNRHPGRHRDRLVSPWLARKDTDWWVDRLYDFAAALDATIIRTAISRTVIDVNRDPSGASLYPGQATTELCPTTTFDGEPLYRDGQGPARTRSRAAEAGGSLPITTRLPPSSSGCAACTTGSCSTTAHSIRSSIPRLFDGDLPALQHRHERRAGCATRARRPRSKPRAMRRRSAASPTGAFAAALSPAITGSRRRACTRSRWSSPAGAICRTDRTRRTRQTGRRLRRPRRARDAATSCQVLEACLAFARATAHGPTTRPRRTSP